MSLPYISESRSCSCRSGADQASFITRIGILCVADAVPGRNLDSVLERGALGVAVAGRGQIKLALALE